MSTPSDTPRTDAEAKLTATGLYVTTVFSETLEREVNALRAALETVMPDLERFQAISGTRKSDTRLEAVRAVLANTQPK